MTLLNLKPLRLEQIQQCALKRIVFKRLDTGNSSCKSVSDLNKVKCTSSMSGSHLISKTYQINSYKCKEWIVVVNALGTNSSKESRNSHHWVMITDRRKGTAQLLTQTLAIIFFYLCSKPAAHGVNQGCQVSSCIF